MLLSVHITYEYYNVMLVLFVDGLVRFLSSQKNVPGCCLVVLEKSTKKSQKGGEILSFCAAIFYGITTSASDRHKVNYKYVHTCNNTTYSTSYGRCEGCSTYRPQLNRHHQRI